jgi:hypothetical protein
MDRTSRIRKRAKAKDLNAKYAYKKNKINIISCLNLVCVRELVDMCIYSVWLNGFISRLKNKS